MATSNQNDRVTIKAFGLSFDGTAGCAKLVAWLGFGVVLAALILMADTPAKLFGAWHRLTSGVEVTKVVMSWFRGLGAGR